MGRPGAPRSDRRIAELLRHAGNYPVDGRGLLYSFIYFSAKHLGAGQFYLMTINDRDGRAFDGSASYRLTVPANAPVRLYWSATVYDRVTHAPIRDMPWASRSSHSPGLEANADGSVDLLFAPEAPAERKANWVPTSAEGEFEILFRFYGPEKPLFEKSWALPDVEKIAQGGTAWPSPSPSRASPAPRATCISVML